MQPLTDKFLKHGLLAPIGLHSEQVTVSQSCLTLRLRGRQPARLLCPWDSPGKNAGVGSHCLLQGIFLTQGSNWGLLHCRQILHCLSHQGSPMQYHNSASCEVSGEYQITQGLRTVPKVGVPVSPRVASPCISPDSWRSQAVYCACPQECPLLNPISASSQDLFVFE